ncbi:hypothetical protein ACYUJ6_10615 [Clostridium sp. JNZ X4-2]
MGSRTSNNKFIISTYPITTDVSTGRKAVRFSWSGYRLESGDYVQLAKDTDLNMYKVTMVGNGTIATPGLLDAGDFDVTWNGYN